MREERDFRNSFAIHLSVYRSTAIVHPAPAVDGFPDKPLCSKFTTLRPTSRIVESAFALRVQLFPCDYQSTNASVQQIPRPVHRLRDREIRAIQPVIQTRSKHSPHRNMLRRPEAVASNASAYPLIIAGPDPCIHQALLNPGSRVVVQH